MTDRLAEHLRRLDDVAAPDLWPAIERREPGPPPHDPRGPRFAAALVALALVGVAIGFAAVVFGLRHGAAPRVTKPRPGHSPTVAIPLPTAPQPKEQAAHGNGPLWFVRSPGESATMVFEVQPDGSGLRQLFSDQVPAERPSVGVSYAWSPDGSRVAFLSDARPFVPLDGPTGGAHEVFVMNAGGSDVREITNDGGYDAAPAWSPDGTRIAYDSDRSDPSRPGCFKHVGCRSNIFVVNPDGTGLTQLTFGAADNSQPAWSPDGSRIAFVSNVDVFHGDIYVMNADGSNVTQLTGLDAEVREPRWSPDGTRIAFVKDDGTSARIWMMNANGSNPVALPGAFVKRSYSVEPDIRSSFAWSPDGSTIAFTGANGNLWTMTAGGTDLHMIAPNASQVSWRPVPAAGG